MEPDDDKTQTHIVLTAGTEVGHYRIIEKIGAGGMGEVYLAEDTQLDRTAALKFLPPHLCQDEECRERFKREAQAAAKLDHPNIVSVYEVGEFQGRPFFAMAHVEGKSLREVIKLGKLTIQDAVKCTMQILEGLHKAHESGVVHRDIKPGNIIIDAENRPRIVDFGLAIVSGKDKLTKTGSTLGTVGYMSPEQIGGKQVDHRSDLFSVGVILYEMLTGRRPFEGDNDAAITRSITDTNPEPIARYKSGTTGELQQIVDKALSKDASLRYQHADGMLADLRRLKTESSPARQSRLGLWAAGAVVLLAVIVLLLWRPWDQGPVTDDVPMIAVLPFDNLGPPEDEYFTDGMTEEITSRLAGIQGLGVISRTSAIKYKNTDKQLREIGKELGVAYILEGTVRWSKEGERSRVRITPQLVRVSDDRHLWADNYERELLEVFEVQADIAGQIVEQLGIRLLEEDKTTLATIPTSNAEAYRLYLRALSAFRRRKDGPDPRKDLDSAIILDPTFALAFALRSQVCSRRSLHRPNSENARVALKSANRSLELRPGLPQGHLALGQYYHLVETDYDRAMEQFSLAESRLKNDPDLFHAISLVHLRKGNVDQAIEYYRMAVDLDPLNDFRHSVMCYWLMHAQRHEEALQVINRAIALDPDDPFDYHRKMTVLESWYGEVDSVIPVAIEALQHCDTMEFAKQDWAMSRYTSILPWDSLAAEYARELLERDTVEYWKLYVLYMDLGNLELTVAYADSARESYRKALEELPDSPNNNSYYGLLLSFLGDCDTAFALGLRGIELIPTDECFW
jgi:TolB-like protein/lipoprotein NlpI/predicted Ser/Thr protein kinase